MMMIYSFAHRIDACVDEISDLDVAATQLNFWREELDKVFSQSGQPLHPICLALKERHLKKPWPATPFYQLLDGMAFDLHTFRICYIYTKMLASI